MDRARRAGWTVLIVVAMVAMLEGGGGGRAIAMAEAYCVKDKKKVEVQNAQKITMKNGKPALQGTCPECGGKVFRIGG